MNKQVSFVGNFKAALTSQIDISASYKIQLKDSMLTNCHILLFFSHDSLSVLKSKQ